MDKTTHEIRLSNWKPIIEGCINRPKGTTVKQWLDKNNINEKTYYYWLRRVRKEVYSQMNTTLPSISSKVQTKKSAIAFAEIPVVNQQDLTTGAFRADAVIRSGSTIIGISNSISDTLLTRLLEVANHAR